ncbi:MAG: carbon-nitrogen hydrolase family protein [Verrucomicrobiota bacterium]
MSSLQKFQIFQIDPGFPYQIKIQSSKKPSDPDHIVAMAEWFGENPGIGSKPRHKPIKAAYLRPVAQGWNDSFTAPKKAHFLRVAIHHWIQLSRPLSSKYTFRLKKLSKIQRGPITLGVAYQSHPPQTTWNKNMAITCKTILDAGRQGVDLLCLSEVFLSRGVSGNKKDLAVPIESPLLRPLFVAAQKAKVHVALSVSEKSKGHFYNTAILISPQGKLLGSYRKRSLTFDELERGIIPGKKACVIDTELGKIGLIICWDAWFPETARALAQQGAEVICLPIAGNGNPPAWEHVWRARAIDNQLFWLTSVTQNCGGRAPSRIISPEGKLLAHTKKANGIAKTTVHLDRRQESFWLSIPDTFSENRNVMDYSYRPSA